MALPHPVTSFVMEKTLKRGGCYVDLPFSVDADAQSDLDHPVMRAMRECSLIKKTTVVLHGTEYVQSYNGSFQCFSTKRFGVYQKEYIFDLSMMQRFYLYNKNRLI